MALISCPECTKKISDQAPSCPQCGCPIKSVREAKAAIVIQRDSSIIYAFNKHYIYIDGEKVGELGRKGQIVFELDIDPSKLVNTVNVQVRMQATLFKTKPLHIQLTPNEVVNLFCGNSAIRNKTYLKLKNVNKNQNITNFIAQGASKGIAQEVVKVMLNGFMK
jgi:hypothetical protein